MSKIVYLGHTDSPDIVITFVVDGTYYNYELPNWGSLNSVLYLIRKVSIGKAFVNAKKYGKLLEPAQ